MRKNKNFLISKIGLHSAGETATSISSKYQQVCTCNILYDVNINLLCKCIDYIYNRSWNDQDVQSIVEIILYKKVHSNE